MFNQTDGDHAKEMKKKRDELQRVEEQIQALEEELVLQPVSYIYTLYKTTYQRIHGIN